MKTKSLNALRMAISTPTVATIVQWDMCRNKIPGGETVNRQCPAVWFRTAARRLSKRCEAQTKYEDCCDRKDRRMFQGSLHLKLRNSLDSAAESRAAGIADISFGYARRAQPIGNLVGVVL